MAELLLMGMTHYPLLATTDAEMAALLRTMMKDPAIPEGLADPRNWSPEMQAEWGDDEARSSAGCVRAKREAA